MTINSLSAQAPFTTKDGSTIRSLLDRSNAPVRNQSLAEASVPAGRATERHYHRLSEEFYFIQEGRGVMEIDGRGAAGGTGRCHPHSGRCLAPDPRRSDAALPVLLRAAVRSRRHVFSMKSPLALSNPATHAPANHS